MSYVLVVDDEPAVQKLLRRILRPCGYEVRVAGTAADALVEMLKARPAVVVCDVHMPGQNGLWLADRIRELCPTTAIILATSDSTVPPLERSRRGVIAYVLKPFHPSQLLKDVEEGVQWSAAEASGSNRSDRVELDRQPAAPGRPPVPGLPDSHIAHPSPPEG